MKKYLCAAAVVACSLATAFAAGLESGLPVGEAVPAFQVVKVAGAADDGVQVGDELCYRCKCGQSPTVMVFARTCDEQLVKLVQALDAQVAANSKLNSFVNLLGEDRTGLEDTCRSLCELSAAENVPFVVPVEFENGPEDYAINPEADLTVIMFRGPAVRENFALAAGELSDEKIAEIAAAAGALAQ